MQTNPTPPDLDELEITQADREAARAWWEGYDDLRVASAEKLARAFARHRLASARALRTAEERIKELEEELAATHRRCSIASTLVRAADMKGRTDAR